MIWKSDNCHIQNFIISTKKIFNLYRINILSATDNDVFLTVNQIDKSIFIFHCHISSIQPAIMKYFSRCFFIFIIASHDSRTFDCQLSSFALCDQISILIDNLCLPAKSCFTDRTDFINMIQSEMHTSRSNRFTQSIVCIIFMIWEIFLPVTNQTWRYRLRTDMHKSPLLQIIILQIYIFVINCKK